MDFRTHGKCWGFGAGQTWFDSSHATGYSLVTGGRFQNLPNASVSSPAKWSVPPSPWVFWGPVCSWGAGGGLGFPAGGEAAGQGWGPGWHRPSPKSRETGPHSVKWEAQPAGRRLPAVAGPACGRADSGQGFGHQSRGSVPSLLPQGGHTGELIRWLSCRLQPLPAGSAGDLRLWPSVPHAACDSRTWSDSPYLDPGGAAEYWRLEAGPERSAGARGRSRWRSGPRNAQEPGPEK